MSTPRLLFVDDEPAIRATMPAILERHGYEVVAAATVSDALSAIQSQRFDVLISDLNIGEPGDGFTVVSAMRRTQPHAVTIIITGYPAFETALRAIRSQVDDYVVKPANVEALLATIANKLSHRTPAHQPVPVRRVGEMLRENNSAVVEQWLERVKQDPELAAAGLTDEEYVNHLPLVLQEIVARSPGRRDGMSAGAATAAARHGEVRRRQGYSILLLLQEQRILRGVLAETVQANLLALDISNLLGDMLAVDDSLDAQFRASVEAFLGGESKPYAA